MRCVVGVARYLHRELATGSQRPSPLRQHLSMVRYPLEAGVGGNNIDWIGRISPGGQVSCLEFNARPGICLSGIQHRRRAVDPHHLFDPGHLAQEGREWTGSAAQVNRPATGRRGEQRVEVMGWSFSLDSELFVALGRPLLG